MWRRVGSISVDRHLPVTVADQPSAVVIGRILFPCAVAETAWVQCQDLIRGLGAMLLYRI